MALSEEQVNRYRRLVAEHRAEGGPVTQFCRRRGISHWTFREWRKRLGADSSTLPARVASAVPGFVPVITPVVSRMSRDAFEVTHASGARLSIPAGYDKGDLRTLLRLLRW
jgi:hypothetical protein